ncbi:hypothetical protein PHISCL_07241 [Aspergillus sclerotialis]|uniref:Uncharacterized protein n=1 Tax=Aspergillus sclerotialis TaxID=2070753 RepID=A0A3A2ZTV1_9EURO|nr:hypothetical protein PHISCL_07241 [Aspergillus sclerotialis]
MCLSIAFIVTDTCAVLGAFKTVLPKGLEPFWKLSFIFKCLCDTVILDDFKTALDRLRTHWLRKKFKSGEIVFCDFPNGLEGGIIRELRPGGIGDVGGFSQRKNRGSMGGNTLVDEFTSLTTISSRDADERC